MKVPPLHAQQTSFGSRCIQLYMVQLAGYVSKKLQSSASTEL
jgi:hypothetical protein